ncbi:hypothetical protein K503DRAFT_864114 [Rhizopogon vinicolor AM-OR11-026]|uniref:F-box domain-containing protein n=1 Tax=Rhizopogon vinicolor AM-OR11-026 TaxID=1314800 RepID=A0A1B7N8E0_9AGAM|nr:hypothetical protein K503DRAFT_864114 [Rhizopogon vinicolor AM-OR11-026]
MSLEYAHSDGDPESMDYDSPLTELEDSGTEYSRETQSEDSGSEYGRETFKKPVKKRAKAVKVAVKKAVPAAKAKVSGSSRQKNTLSLIVTMPLDVLFEIFDLLQPSDLLHLSRTNKAFCEVLSSNNAASVWKTVRVNRGGIPDCMPGMSEVQWANLFFGGSQCHVCGVSKILRIDFGIRCRACTRCLKKNLVFESSFSSKFPGFNPLIMDLIPFANIGGWAHGHASGSKFFWSADVFQMAEQFGAYQKDAYMGKRGAKQALEVFMELRRKYVVSVINHAAVCNTWVNEDRKRHLNDIAELRSQNDKLIRVRLLDLGHNTQDVERLFLCRDIDIDKELTDARWKRLLPNIERKLSEVKEERRLEEQMKASSARRGHLMLIYIACVRQFRATQWASMPIYKEFFKFPDVAEFIDSLPSDGQDSEACRIMMDRLRVPELCAEYVYQKKLALAQLLASSSDISQDTLTLASQGTDTRDTLQLATSIFQCTRSGALPLITWDKVQYHKCDFHNITPNYGWSNSLAVCTFEISDPGVVAACSLLSLVGLDPEITTAGTMDQLPCLFFCSGCPPMSENGGSYRMAMDWRRSVFHYVEQRDALHSEPRWELLSAAQLEAVQSLRALECPGPYGRICCCNKCDAHFGNAVTKAAVIDHLRSHGITSPKEGVDFIYAEGLVKRPPPGTKTFVIPQVLGKPTGPGKIPPNRGKQDYCCQHCPRSSRTFVLGGVRHHLRDKHKIVSPSLGVDYHKIK